MTRKVQQFPIRYRLAVRDAELSSAAKNVAYVFSTCMNAAGYAYPGAALLVKGTGLSRRTVWRALEELERADWLLVVKRGSSRKGQQREATEYRGFIPNQCHSDHSHDGTSATDIHNPCQTDDGLVPGWHPNSLNSDGTQMRTREVVALDGIREARQALRRHA